MPCQLHCAVHIVLLHMLCTLVVSSFSSVAQSNSFKLLTCSPFVCRPSYTMHPLDTALLRHRIHLRVHRKYGRYGANCTGHSVGGGGESEIKIKSGIPIDRERMKILELLFIHTSAVYLHSCSLTARFSTQGCSIHLLSY